VQTIVVGFLALRDGQRDYPFEGISKFEREGPGSPAETHLLWMTLGRAA
jgi:hypothetical protein